MEIDMKLLALVVLGVLVAVALTKADDVKLTDEAVTKLHSQLNICDEDAKQSGMPMFGECSEVQFKLSKHYSSYAAYQIARKANQ